MLFATRKDVPVAKEISFFVAPHHSVLEKEEFRETTLHSSLVPFPSHQLRLQDYRAPPSP